MPELNDAEIDLLVVRYTREMARYEDAARLVEDRLRRALRAKPIRALLSSRAKHPDDLRVKLAKKRADPRYTFAALDGGLNEIVTDLAGCRIMLYRSSEVAKAEHAVLEALERANLPNDIEHHDKKESDYRATHVLVRVEEDEDRMSLRGSICEVQIASLASHVFNELEHDIRYKEHDGPPSDEEKAILADVLHAARLLDSQSEHLLVAHADTVAKRTVSLNDAEALRFVLEQGAHRSLRGDFRDLFRLLSAVMTPLTASAIVAPFENVGELIAQGAERASALGLPELDDAVSIALALFQENAPEFVDATESRRGPSTALKKAILKADQARKDLS